MSRRIDIPPRLMPAPVAAAYLGVSESFLRNMDIPRRKLGAKRLYDVHDLDRVADLLPYEGSGEINTCDEAFGLTG